MITKIIPEEKIQQSKKWIDEAENIVIVSHSSPDGDAVGSSLAMYHFLLSIDKNVSVVLPDTFPDFLGWIEGSKEIVIYTENKDKAKDLLASADLIFALDFNTLSRVKYMEDILDEAPGKKILVDHHLFPGHFAQLIISHPEISSTSEMIFRLITRMGHFPDINLSCAEAIYMGMMTDTGAFTFNSNSAEIYIIVSELIKKGIDKDLIYRNVYNNYTANRLRLMGYVLSEKMRVYPECKAAAMTLTIEEQNRFHFRKGDAEGFVNMPLSVKGIIFTAIFREDADDRNKIRVSMRSQGTFPVNDVVQKYYHGGGHLNAAGGECEQTNVEDAIAFFENTVLPQYKELLKES